MRLPDAFVGVPTQKSIQRLSDNSEYDGIFAEWMDGFTKCFPFITLVIAETANNKVEKKGIIRTTIVSLFPSSSQNEHKIKK